MKGAIYAENSKNEKISGDSKVDATYASIKATCPNTCALKGAGCYASTSYTGMIVARMDRRARQDSPLQVARSEAKAIDQSYNGGPVPQGRPLRLHVSGDTRVRKGVRLIASAVKRWKKRGGGDCWSYTHSRNVPRKDWGDVSILASIDHISQEKEMRAKGYACAIVVDHHQSDRAIKLNGSETKWIPCLQQTRNIPCVKCRLCFNADRLYRDGFGIAFAAHGTYKNAIKKRLTVIQ